MLTSLPAPSSSSSPGELPADIPARPGAEVVTDQSDAEDGGLGDEERPGDDLGGRHEAEALVAALLEAEQGRGRGRGNAGHGGRGQESPAVAGRLSDPVKIPASTPSQTR